MSRPFGNNDGNISHLTHRQVNGNSTRLPESSWSEYCNCQRCPKVHPRQLYSGTGLRGISRLEDQFSDSNEGEIRNIGRRIACQYNLKNLKSLFEKAALLTHDSSWFYVARSENSDRDSQRIPSASLPQPAANQGETTTEAQNAGQFNSNLPNGASDLSESVSPPQDEGLTEHEDFILKNESKLDFWDQPWPFRSTCYMLFTAAIVQGWIQTSTNGADICFLDPLIDPAASSSGQPTDDLGCVKRDIRSRVIYGIINAAPFLFGTIGCWTVDWLNEKLMGRRRAIMVSTVLILASAIASAFVTTWWALLVCRVFLGIGMGGKAAVVPVFLAEISPAHIRGTTIMNWQVFDALGISMGFTANLLASLADKHDIWRWQVGSSAIPSFALLIGLLLVPWDSPRFEMKHEKTMFTKYKRKKRFWEYMHPQWASTVETRGAQRMSVRRVVSPPWFGRRLLDTMWFRYGPHPGLDYHSKTFDTLVILRGNELLAAKELVFTHAQLMIQKLSVDGVRPGQDDFDFAIESLSWWTRLRHLFQREKYLSRELTAAVIVMIAQQTCGINFLIFYSVRLFTATSGPSVDTVQRLPIWLSWAMGIVNFLFAIPAYYWIKSRGRRWLVLTTMPLLSLMLVLAAGTFQSSEPARKGTVITWTLLFTIIYSPGLGPVPFTLSAELFPLEYRIVGMSMVVSINFFVGGVFIFLLSLVRLKDESIPLGAFAIANFLVWFLVYAYVREPEIKPDDGEAAPAQIALEVIYQVYSPPHWRYFEFLRRQKWDPFRMIRGLFMSQGSLQPPLQGRQYFLNWLFEMQEDHGNGVRSAVELDTISDHEIEGAAA